MLLLKAAGKTDGKLASLAMSDNPAKKPPAYFAGGVSGLKTLRRR
jgi:hypothetical protein